MNPQDSKLIVFTHDDDRTDIEVRFDADTVWLTQQQLGELFGTSRTNVVEHLQHIYDEEELVRERTCRDFRQVRVEGSRRVARDIPHYNLDAIISVGYRVKSKVATQFRIWATQRLRDLLVQGYALNEHRLDQLGAIVRVLGRASDELVSGVTEVLSWYLPSLQLLRDYDEGLVETAPGVLPGWTLTIEGAREVIAQVGAEFPTDVLFGRQRGDALQGVVGAIYQGFGGQDLYPTVQEKAANLLYLVVKDHPLSDGNKRSAAALFVHFLAKNGLLFDQHGSARISNNALAAITLMVAMSDPKEKSLMVALLTRMLAEQE